MNYMAKRIIIPARMASTRLPGKMLLDIAGKPMLQRTYEQACQCDVDSVLIAADEHIAEAAASWGADVCLTKSDHSSGTSRIAEAAEIRHYHDEDLIVNVQGDEPLIPKQNIEQVFDNLQRHPDASVATLMDQLDHLNNVLSPDTVKVITDKSGYALYFSRAPIPWGRDIMPNQLPDDMPYWLHIGIYGYRCNFLKHYTALQPSPIENIEKLEQLRVLWHGYKIHVAPASVSNPAGIDTQAGLAQIRKLFK